MLSYFFGWREVLITNDMQHYFKVIELLREAGLKYHVKARNMFHNGRRGGSMGLTSQYMYSYQIYVKKPHLEQAYSIIHGGNRT